MALQSINSDKYLVFPSIGVEGVTLIATNDTNIDAAGEGLGMIGAVRWADGASHVVSSAGGKITWIPNSATFANAGTTLRVGIQDVSAGLPDGTYDVYKELVGGTDTLTAAALTTTAMATGTKTIAHGDVIAVVFTMTARGGSDVVAPRRTNLTTGFPYCTVNSGGGHGKNNSMPCCLIEADDGVLGILGPSFTIPMTPSSLSFNSGSTPDEYAIIFQVPFKCSIDHLCVNSGETDAGENASLILYTDPLGTPTAQRTAVLDPTLHQHEGSGTGFLWQRVTEYTLEPGTTYAIAYVAQSTGNRTLRAVTIPLAGARQFTLFGATLRGGTRSDSTGAFAESTTTWAILGFAINKLDDGVGGSGGGGIRLAGHGGLAG